MSDANGKNGDLVKTLINGGLVSIALVALYLNWSMQKDFTKILINDLMHTTTAIVELRASIEQINKISEAQIEVLRIQAQAIDGLKNAIIQFKR